MIRVCAYTYDADYHCVDCTKKYIRRYSPDPLTEYEVQDILNGDATFYDSENNEIHPLFDIDEWYANDIYEGNDSATLGCSDCGCIIDEVNLTD